MIYLRHVLVVLLLVMGAQAAPAATLKIATVAPDGTAWMREMRSGADEIAERTDGRVKLKFYPGGVMGNYATVMRKMRLGQLHGGAFTGGEVAELYPDFNLYSLPFMFRSLEEVAAVRKVLDPLVIAGLEEKGLMAAGIAGGGFAYLFSRERIAQRADLSGRKIWVPEGDDVSYTFMEVAGVPGIPMSLADVYTALQTGALDTVINTPVGAIAFQWHTKVRNMVDLPVSYVVGLLALDVRTMRNLKQEDRDVVMDVLARVSKRLESINIDDNAGARTALAKQGIAFQSLDETEKSQWWEAGEQTVDALIQDKTYEHDDVLQSTLEAYRSSDTASGGGDT